MTPTQLTDWKSGDDLLASHLQEAVDFCKQLGLSLAGPGLVQFSTPAGTNLAVKDELLGPTMFPVRVVQSGGADGTDTTQATYTYDVYHLTGTPADTATDGTLIEEDVQLRNASNGLRANGSIVAGDGYGVAFYDGGTLILWDAGEVENTGEGCAP